MTDFAGRWQTTFGLMELTQERARVRGAYHYRGVPCPIEAKVAGGRLTFRYQEPDVRGEGWLELTRRGRAFAGLFRPEGTDRWAPWEGERVGFDGLWNTSYGLLRLAEDGGEVRGFYEAGGGGTLRGRPRGSRLAFQYREPRARGRGAFELADDGLSFQGEWKPKGADAWAPWMGLRVRPRPDLVWLVVLEAPWQRFLAEQEYAFGHMLREFCARHAHVQMRHRFFSNEAGLRRCCRDLLYIAEPVILLLATHAVAEGIRVNGELIPVESLEEILGHAGNLRLLHFSACLIMQDPAVVARWQAFSRRAGVPVSGYRTSVNWGASAIIEFTYLELMLAQGLPPAEAADQLVKLLPFAGDEGVPGGAFAPAGFRLVTPEPARKPRKSAAPRKGRRTP
jgi:hypothetical protein